MLEVYPRAYGGTRDPGARPCEIEGLSPRVRGNPESPGALQPLDGSIPARTGEPGQVRYPISAKRVYPRAYGGTGSTTGVAVRVQGLSPRVRGNR